MITDFHAKYFAYEISKRCSSGSVEKLTAVLADAQVDLVPASDGNDAAKASARLASGHRG